MENFMRKIYRQKVSIQDMLMGFLINSIVESDLAHKNATEKIYSLAIDFRIKYIIIFRT